MGYFSELDLENKEKIGDNSYHDYQEQLLWRYEDLRERYSQLSGAGAPMYGDDCFDKNGYRYSPAECFGTLSDVCRAMEIAREELEEKCGVVIDDEGSVIDRAKKEHNGQISIFEIVLFPSGLLASVAA